LAVRESFFAAIFNEFHRSAVDFLYIQEPGQKKSAGARLPAPRRVLKPEDAEGRDAPMRRSYPGQSRRDTRPL
jgi:hypothetical protein